MKAPRQASIEAWEILISDNGERYVYSTDSGNIRNTIPG